MYLLFLAALSAPGYWLCWQLFTMPTPALVRDHSPAAPELAEPESTITFDSDYRGLI